MNSIFLFIICLCADTSPKPIRTYYVDFFELNHYHNGDGELVLDQVILWEWVDYRYRDEDGFNQTQRETKVVDWYLVTKYRKRLTEEEQRKKDKELAQEWVKKFGIGADLKAPPYVPPFEGGILIPRYDQDRKMWKVLTYKNGVTTVVYGTSFVESWTQFDRETDNQELFSRKSRRNILGTNSSFKWR